MEQIALGIVYDWVLLTEIWKNEATCFHQGSAFMSMSFLIVYSYQKVQGKRRWWTIFFLKFAVMKSNYLHLKKTSAIGENVQAF